MLPLGTTIPHFQLPDTAGKEWTPEEFKEKRALVVMFICNHCPFVKHIKEELMRTAFEYESRGVGFVGINSNDVEKYPDDSPEKMAKEGYPFPYLMDETQEVAKAYRAACTPDLYVFDQNRKLVYRGQFDESRPGNNVPVTGKNLREALDAVLAGNRVGSEQKPSLGCNIKWKPGNEPDYFQAA